MKHPIHYKLTDQDQKTYGGFRWEIGKWHKANGRGELCGPGWLHFYTHPLLAVFFNQIHADIENPKLWEAEVNGETLDDHGTKCGWTKGRIVREIPLPVITTEQRMEIGIRCAMTVYKENMWTQWATNWLNGKDRSADSAYATNATYAATYAAHLNIDILAIINSVVGEG